MCLYTNAQTIHDNERAFVIQWEYILSSDILVNRFMAMTHHDASRHSVDMCAGMCMSPNLDELIFSVLSQRVKLI